ncbi:unnamed protein product [Callosobruchus maculatus]|uniref:Lipocalin/cytosolic fatty-acid binding domain-containing protein n=1 Tax=Callosobruchus maculatus TaxID=64391 RepID=A0A653BDP4_CALMS|nr:unnamed protein product [Callosobruchus maculatus]
MVQIAGKYKLERNENFIELLIKQGTPEQHAKFANEDKPVLTIEVNGDKIKITTSESKVNSGVVEYQLGKSIQETMGSDHLLNSTAKLDGNTLTIESTAAEGGAKALTRVYTFTDTGLEVIVRITGEGSPTEAKRIYKRL